MPKIITAEEMKSRRGEGWTVTGLADAEVIGEPAMVARRWTVEPRAATPAVTHQDADQLLYVIRGGGAAIVDGRRLALEPECVLWLEPGERYAFEAGDEGLEILQGYAPGEVS